MKKLLLLIASLGVSMSIRKKGRVIEYRFSLETEDDTGKRIKNLYKEFDIGIINATPDEIMDGAIVDQLVSEVKLKFQHNYSEN